MRWLTQRLAIVARQLILVAVSECRDDLTYINSHLTMTSSPAKCAKAISSRRNERTINCQALITHPTRHADIRHELVKDLG